MRHLGALILCLIAVAADSNPIAAQEVSVLPAEARADETDQARFARADSIRASYDRPPSNPLVDFTNVVEVPFRLIGYPFLIVGETVAFVVGQITLPRPPSAIVRAHRNLDREGLLVSGATSIGPRSGFAGTLTFHRFAPFYATSGWSVRGSREHSAKFAFDDGALGGNRFELGWSFQRDENLRFWGIGSDTSPDLLSEFQRDRHVAGASGRYWLHPAVGVEGRVQYETFETAAAGGDDTPSVEETFGPIFGVTETNEYVVAGGSLLLHFTRRTGFQTRGIDLQFDAATFRGVDDTDSDFHRIGGSANVYLPLNTRQMLAVRGQASTLRDDGDSGSDGIPFYALNTLGGSRTSRGFRTGRFADNDVVAIMGEWRYEVWHELQDRARMEVFLFLDEGAVANRLSDLTSDDWHTSYGFGFRFVTAETLGFVTFFGFSDEETRFGFRTDWPF